MSPSTGSRGASRTGPTTRATSSTPKPQTRSGPGTLRGVPIKSFGRDLYLDGRIIPLDLSTELGIHGGPATSPALVAHFVRIRGGEQATEPRFRPTKFRRADAVARLDDIASRPGANDKSRVSVLLANAEEEQTLTITHVLWAMFGLLPCRLGGGRRVRHATGLVARALQRVGGAGASHPDPGCRPADLPAEPGHPVLRPAVITHIRTGC